jgi:hypothetical protein
MALKYLHHANCNVEKNVENDEKSECVEEEGATARKE